MTTARRWPGGRARGSTAVACRPRGPLLLANDRPVDGGYGDHRAPDGLRTEGAAQMATAFVLRRMAGRAVRLWPVDLRQQSADGGLLATPDRTRTGPAIGPDSTTDDVRDDRVPHLGANPFTGGTTRR